MTHSEIVAEILNGKRCFTFNVSASNGKVKGLKIAIHETDAMAQSPSGWAPTGQKCFEVRYHATLDQKKYGEDRSVNGGQVFDTLDQAVSDAAHLILLKARHAKGTVALELSASEQPSSAL